MYKFFEYHVEEEPFMSVEHAGDVVDDTPTGVTGPRVLRIRFLLRLVRLLDLINLRILIRSWMNLRRSCGLLLFVLWMVIG